MGEAVLRTEDCPFPRSHKVPVPLEVDLTRTGAVTDLTPDFNAPSLLFFPASAARLLIATCVIATEGDFEIRTLKSANEQPCFVIRQGRQWNLSVL
jgi:hypothetical protein